MLENIIKKISHNDFLTSEESSYLQNIELTVQKTSGWVGTDGNPKLNNPVIMYPDFRTSPLHVFMALRTVVDDIPDSTWSDVGFSNSFGDRSVFDFLEGTTSGTAIKIEKGVEYFTIDGVIGFQDGGGVGYRALFVRLYDEFGNGLPDYELGNFLPTGAGIDYFNFCLTVRILGTNTVPNYFKIQAYQNSGGALDITYCNLTVRIA